MLEIEELSEISTFKRRRNVFVNTKRFGYTPVEKGDTIGEIHFMCPLLKGLNMRYGCPSPKGYVSISEILLSKEPVVLAFYSAETFNGHVIRDLESMAKDTEVMGGKLVLITSVFRKEILQTLGENHSLTVYYDIDNQLNEGFGLYQENNPLSDWISGINNEKASLPAIYVIDNQKEVIYRHVDYSLGLFSKKLGEQEKIFREMLTIVYHANQHSVKAN